VTSERPRRRRRIDLPAASLPRPTAGAAAPRSAPGRPAPTARPLHHVNRDYSYVRRDLLGILVVGLISFGFIGVMSFVVR
jgi:hypothetical protein